MNNNLYNKYYETISPRCWERVEKKEDMFGKEYWNTKGDSDLYDMPLTENKTKISSSEWNIFHHMIIQVLIDFVNKYPIDNDVNTYSMNIDLETGEWKTYLNDIEPVIVNVPDSDIDYMYNVRHGVEDKDIIDSYDGLNHRIYFFVCEFLRRHQKDLEVDVNKFYFRIDNLKPSLENKRWVAESDSSLSLCEHDNLILCSMLI